MKHLPKLALISLFVLAGCLHNEDTIGVATSGETEYQEKCIDGVVYLLRKRGYQGYFSVKFNSDSTVVTCERIAVQGERAQ